MAGKIKPGGRFGQLTVLRELKIPHIEPSGHKRRRYWVQCSCGRKYKVFGYYLLRTKWPRCKQCYYDSLRCVSIGDRFDKLEVISIAGSVALCRCDCGNRVKIRSSCLKTNMTNNCGCSVRGKWSGAGDLSGAAFYRIRRNAEARGISFRISAKSAWKLFVKQGGKCALTGLTIEMSKSGKQTGKQTASLDRVDSSKGYFLRNVQWVHKDINKMKMDFSQERFVYLCDLVSGRQR
jgi:hypothetical protein